jgi:uncharacterized protein (DUF1800 family)
MNRRSFLGFSSNSEEIKKPASLAEWRPSSGEWNIQAVNHIYNRLGFGATVQEIEIALTKTPAQLIDELMDDSLVTSAMPEPPDGYEQWMYKPPYQGTNYDEGRAEDDLEHNIKVDLRNWWTVLMTKPNVQLREKLVLFWHNHFVIEEVKVYFSVHLWRYFEYLRKNCWGNLRQMTKDITVMPAMLKYLDGIWSEKTIINENYAREVMELFTMGIADREGNKNYTQDDVRNLAFAVTGWRFRFEDKPPMVLSEYFADYYFDFQTKRSLVGSEPKINGLHASNDPRIEVDAFDVLFAQREKAIAWHIAKKVYANFIYMGDEDASPDAIIQELADTLIASNWEMKPMFMKLFKSELFFDVNYRGAAIKCPYEFMMGVFRKLDVPISAYQAGSLWYYGRDTGQILGNPTNVKGWTGYRTWLNTATLPKRINDILRKLLIGGFIDGQIINPHNGFIFDGIPFTDDQVTSWAKQFASYSQDLNEFLSDINQYLLVLPISDARLQEILSRCGLLHTYEWPMLDESAKVQPVRRLLFELLGSPEYQLA